MRSSLRLAASAFILTASVPASIWAQDRWGEADRQIKRLAPSAFPKLPSSVRADLEGRGCTIPQVWRDTLPGNVIAGHFRDSSQVDWAVLCSINRVSTVLVYWAGRPDSVGELSPAPDKNLLQTVGGGQIGYSRAIGIARPDVIRQYYQWYDGTEPPLLDHQGIEDAFVEKGSVVWYWDGGKWLMLSGAD